MATPPPPPDYAAEGTRVYVGNLPRDVTKEDVSRHFGDGGQIREVKLMNGFGFLEFGNSNDARDAVPAFHGTELGGQTLTVQFARGSRGPRVPYGGGGGGGGEWGSDRPQPRPRRTGYRMSMSDLPYETSWQDLKDFARSADVDVVYSEIGRGRDGTGFVEFETSSDLRVAVEKLNGAEFKGSVVRCFEDTQEEGAGGYQGSGRNYQERYRSRSPPPYRRGGGGGGYDRGQSGGNYDDYRDSRGPPQSSYSRGQSPPPRRDDYRRRSPPPRGDYYSRDSRGQGYGGGGGASGYRSPPPARNHRGDGPHDDHPPPRNGGYRDGQSSYGGPPPRRGGYDEPRDTNGGGGYRPARRSPPPQKSYNNDRPANNAPANDDNW